MYCRSCPSRPCPRRIKSSPTRYAQHTMLNHPQSHREIVFPTRKLVVCCDSEAILQKWVDTVNTHVRAERGGGQVEMEEEIAHVEVEAHRQITFNILLGVLKRWVIVDWARSVAHWKMNLFIDKRAPAQGSPADVHPLKAKRASCDQLYQHKQEERQENEAALRHKWQTARTALEEEVLELKQQNKQLRHNAEKEKSAPPRTDTIEVSRSEFIELMEAAANTFAAEQQPIQLAELQDQLRESQASAARASKEATAAMQRVQHLEGQLRDQAQHSLLGEGTVELAMLRGVISNKASPARSPVAPGHTPPKENSSWISRYKAIVNTDF
eukprot:TRINITY_DN2808_c0_g1_i4.p1 TRINITY_DN2808_c0_g1~~TRINITY_DN2808_c0_g1_i4.p1  ORF type:complete len:326 (+),score=74.55 TRINITY_DN2808_c0_g1_i4:365-1342(+)